MATPIDVVFLLQDLAFGGTQRQTLELARRMDKKKFTVTLWTLSGPTDLEPIAEKYGLKVNNLGITPYPGMLFPFTLLWQLMKDCPDVLVPCTALPNIWGRIIGWLRRVPVIVGTCRGGGAPVRQHEKYLWRLVSHMVCNSMQLHETMRNMGMPSARVTYIPNGVDTDFFEPGPDPVSSRKPIILCVARLVRDKDHVTLMRAFGRVLERVPNAELYLVGDGPQEFILRQFVEGPPFKGRVRFIQASTDVRLFYQQAKVFVLASIREGQPNAILEAMSSGLPVVATDVGGVPGLVYDGLTGVLVPASNAITLGDQITRLLMDPNLCDLMGRNGRATVIEKFAFGNMVNSHEKLFDRLFDLKQKKLHPDTES